MVCIDCGCCVEEGFGRRLDCKCNCHYWEGKGMHYGL